MNSSAHFYPKPPRLLLGASVLVWGGLTNHALIALGASLLIEARHWINWRWNFEEKAYSQSWILSLIALAFTVIFHSLNAVGPTSFLLFLEWLPIIFLPLILAQQYGKKATIPATVFSIIAKQRQRRDERLGKKTVIPQVQVGYPYFGLTLLSAGYLTTGEKEQGSYFIMLLILVAIFIYYSHRSNQRRILPWIFVIAMVASLSFVSSRGLIRLFDWVKANTQMRIQGTDPPEENITAIGKVGELKLDRKIQWRIKTPSQTLPPSLLMSLSYNFYNSGKWQAIDSESANQELAFQELLTLAGEENSGKFAFDVTDFDQSSDANQFPPLSIRGAINSNRHPFPCPTGAKLFSKADEVDFIVRNSLGSLLVLNASGVIDLEIWSDGNSELREPSPLQPVRDNTLERKKTTNGLTELCLPTLDGDPRDEVHTLEKIVQDLNLTALSDQDKIKALREFFEEDFSYTTHLSIGNRQKRSPLVNFLTSTKSGHCEYFATATTLLLRAAGVPTRYVVGYAVKERGREPGEYVLRGNHAHAWCRAYLGGQKEIILEERTIIQNGEEIPMMLNRVSWTGGKWVDVDLTPPDWENIDSPPLSFQEKLSDSFQRWREDFDIWRSEKTNRGWVNLSLGVIAVAVVIFLIWRLNSSRIRNQKREESSRSLIEGPQTALSLVLPKLEERLGKRPEGMLLETWLRKELAIHSQGNFSENYLLLKELERLMILHEFGRFSKRALSKDENQELLDLVEALLKSCSHSTMV